MHVIRLLTLGVAFIALLGAGCTSTNVKKVNYDSSANANQEVQNLERDIADGYTHHYDVLASKEFTSSQKYFEKAKRQLSDNHPSEAFTNLGYARGYLNEAKETAGAVEGVAKGILEARSAALSAGARDFDSERATLKKLDDDLRSETPDMAQGQTSPGRWAALQKGYMTLELAAIQDSKLANVRTAIRSAVRNGAKKNCPNMLAQAARDLAAADNTIAANRHDDEAINPAVEQAARSAQLLLEVLAATKRPGGVIDEDAAREIVLKNRQINAMSRKLQAADSQMSAEGRQLERQNQELKSADVDLTLNKALEDARKEFDPQEAEVFRQGNKLLIRLKAVGFRVGHSDLPAKAMPLLAKVKDVADELNPQQIVIEGHTDSTGKAQMNKVLSQDRADAVAEYLASNGIDKDKIQTVGVGYEKPLRSDKSAFGRAQNRRVDVVIIPGEPSESSSAQE